MVDSIILDQIGHKCMVLSLENDILFYGYIHSVENELIMIKSHLLINSNVNKRKHVKIVSVNKLGESITFKASVVHAADSSLMLREPAISSNASRLFYRVNTDIKVDVFFDIEDDYYSEFNMDIDIDKIENIDDIDIDSFDDYDDIVTATVKDLSLGGACIAFDSKLKLGTEFIINIKLYDKYFMLSCIVRSDIKKVDGNFYYGCEFLYLDETETNYLSKFIFSQHRDNINKIKMAES